jgi:hypothetical protein
MKRCKKKKSKRKLYCGSARPSQSFYYVRYDSTTGELVCVFAIFILVSLRVSNISKSNYYYFYNFLNWKSTSYRPI